MQNQHRLETINISEDLSAELPLVLKPNPAVTALRIIYCLSGLLAATLIPSISPSEISNVPFVMPRSFVKVYAPLIASIALLIIYVGINIYFIIGLLQALFHNKVHVYKDKIVGKTIWSERHVMLSEASLQIVNGFMGWGFTFIYKRGEPWISRILNGVFCDHRLTGWDNVSKLHTALAELSGRPIEEFRSHGDVMMEKLVQEKKKRRGITLNGHLFPDRY